MGQVISVDTLILIHGVISTVEQERGKGWGDEKDGTKGQKKAEFDQVKQSGG